MVKAKSYYIWEGNDIITITRGFAPASSTNDVGKRDFLIKHKGLFTKYFPVQNVDNTFICEPKQLCIGHTVDGVGKIVPRIMEGWTIQRILVDLMTQQPYTVDINVRLKKEIMHWRNQCEIYRRLYLEERRKIMTLTGNDRLKAKIREQFKTVSDAKNMIYGGGGMDGYSSYFPRYGLGGTNVSNSTNE